MAYEVRFSKPARKQLNALPDQVIRRVVRRADALAEQPRPHDVKKVEGETDIYRIRVGDYRVIYRIMDEVLVVLVVRVAHRRDAYRGL